MMGTPFVRPTLLIFACILWAACGTITRQVEEGIERELSRVIGPAEHYEVNIDGLRARSGEADRVSVLGEQVQPEEAPLLNRLDLDLYGVRFDRDEKRLERVDSARGTARVRPDDLATFLEEHRNVQQARVDLLPPNQATIRIQPTVAGFTLPRGASVEITGQLVSEEGQVRFDVSELRAAGANLGNAAARRLTETINPLVDLSGTSVNLQVTSVRIENGEVRLDATGDPTGLRLQ